jgi:XisH protein
MARDKYHQQVRQALENRGWRIIDDPLRITIGNIVVNIDLSAESVIEAEKDGERIAVEIKTFGGLSFISDFHDAIGQYIVYRDALTFESSDMDLYLAMPKAIYDEYGSEPLIDYVLKRQQVKLIIYESKSQSIQSWIK